MLIRIALSELLEHKSQPETKQEVLIKNKTKTYIMYERVSDLYKIGRSIDIPKRHSTLTPYIPEIKVILSLNNDVEKEIHKEYHGKRIRGEWFKLNADDVLDIIKKYNFIIWDDTKANPLQINTESVTERKQVYNKFQKQIA